MNLCSNYNEFKQRRDVNGTHSFSPQNLIAQSQSGTGKTAAFVLAMLSHVDPENKWPQVWTVPSSASEVKLHSYR